MDCFGTYFTHAQTCNVTRGESATEWTASVHTLHMLWAHPTLFTLMPWIGLILSCKKKNLLETPTKKSNEGAQVKKGLKTPYCRVGERPGLRVYIYILYIYIYTYQYIEAYNIVALVSWRSWVVKLICWTMLLYFLSKLYPTQNCGELLRNKQTNDDMLPSHQRH